MKQIVYIETTIISYLTAWPSRDIIRLSDQMSTRDWWESQRDRFRLVTSELTLLESAAGDSLAAAERMTGLKDIPLIDAGQAAESLAASLVSATVLPAGEIRDALHVAIAATNGVDYLLTWNCKHLANATIQFKIADVCGAAGFRAPIITTPTHLFDEAYHERRSRSD